MVYTNTLFFLFVKSYSRNLLLSSYVFKGKNPKTLRPNTYWNTADFVNTEHHLFVNCLELKKSYSFPYCPFVFVSFSLIQLLTTFSKKLLNLVWLLLFCYTETLWFVKPVLHDSTVRNREENRVWDPIWLLRLGKSERGPKTETQVLKSTIFLIMHVVWN